MSRQWMLQALANPDVTDGTGLFRGPAILTLEHVAQEWEPVLRRKTCDRKKLAWVA